jgi:hypothetical protein
MLEEAENTPARGMERMEEASIQEQGNRGAIKGAVLRVSSLSGIRRSERACVGGCYVRVALFSGGENKSISTI